MSIYGKGIFIGGGGGGGFPVSDAVIHVNAPNGSTISYSYGGIVVAIQSASDSHINALNSNTSDWYYPVSTSNYGSWTVTATLNQRSASSIIGVMENKQFDITLVYRLYVYNLGDMFTTLTGGYEPAQNGGTFTNTASYMQFLAAASATERKATTVNAIDLSNYTDMYASGHCAANPTNLDLYRVGIGTTKGTYTRWARVACNTSTSAISHINFSDIDRTSPFYIQFSNASQQNPTVIDYIYFE